MTYRKTNDWRAYPVDGWIADRAGRRCRRRLTRCVTRRTLCSTTTRRSTAASMRRWRWPPIRRRARCSFSWPPRTGSPISCARRLARSSSTTPTAASAPPPSAYFRGRAADRAMTVADVASRTGDAARGEARVRRRAVRRAIAWAADQAPTSGPTSPTSRRSSIAPGLIEAIVNPNAAIAFGFSAELFVTRKRRGDHRLPPGRWRDGVDPRRLRPRADRSRARRSRGARASEIEPDARPARACADRAGRRRHRRVPDEAEPLSNV